MHAGLQRQWLPEPELPGGVRRERQLPPHALVVRAVRMCDNARTARKRTSEAVHRNCEVIFAQTGPLLLHSFISIMRSLRLIIAAASLKKCVRRYEFDIGHGDWVLLSFLG